MSSLIDNIKSEAGHVLNALEPEFHAVAALVWRDSTKVLGSVEAAGRQVGAKDLSALRDMAVQIVGSVQKDPAFVHAVGSWQFGVACSMLVQQLGKGLLSNIPMLAQDTVETLVQTAFASVITGLKA
jgi:hypothetical protein